MSRGFGIFGRPVRDLRLEKNDDLYERVDRAARTLANEIDLMIADEARFFAAMFGSPAVGGIEEFLRDRVIDLLRESRLRR